MDRIGDQHGIPPDAADVRLFDEELAQRRRREFRVAVTLVVVFATAQFVGLTIRAIMVPSLPNFLDPRRVVVHLFAALMCVAIYAILWRVRTWTIRRRGLFAAGLGVVAATLVQAVNDILYYAGENGDPSMPYHAGVFVSGALFWLWFVLAWSGMYLAASYSLDVRERERKLALVRSLAKDAQVRALRYQINPHFLFNTLNSIASLVVDRENETAERMVLALADFFRAGLAIDPMQDVSLRDELALQMAYLEVEGMRFGDRLKTVIDVPESVMDVRVPNLLLQPLVENAVRHGVAPHGGPTVIRILAERDGDQLVLSVENDIAPQVPQRGNGTGTGLANVRHRVGLRYGDAASFAAEKSDTRFRALLRVPLQPPPLPTQPIA